MGTANDVNPFARVVQFIQHVRDKLACFMPSDAAVICNVTCGSRNKGPQGFKHSYHLVFPQVYFQRVDTAMKHWVLNHLTLPDEVDKSVYTKNRCMRTICSTKCGDTQPLAPVCSRDGSGIRVMLEHLADYLITVPLSDKALVCVTESQVGFRAPQEPRMRHPKTARTPVQRPSKAASDPTDPANPTDADDEDFFEYLRHQLEQFGYSGVRWLDEYQGGRRFEWDITHADPLDLPERMTFHSTDNRCLVKWDTDTDRVTVHSFSKRVHRTSATLCSVSGMALLTDDGSDGFSYQTLNTLTRAGNMPEALLHVRRNVIITAGGNPMLYVREFNDLETRGSWKQNSLGKGIVALNEIALEIKSDVAASEKHIKASATLDQLEAKKAELVRPAEPQYTAVPAGPEEREAARAVREANTRLRQEHNRALRGYERELSGLEKQLAKTHAMLAELEQGGGVTSVKLGEFIKNVVVPCDGVVWRPDCRVPRHWRNLWRGYAVEQWQARYPCNTAAANKKLEDVLWHIRHILCNNNHAFNEWFLDFLAHIMQNPSSRPGVCPVFSSNEGAGKGQLETLLRLMLGEELVVTVNDDQTLVGIFNGHLNRRLLIVANELGHMGAAHKQANRLKALVTDKLSLITLKGVDSVEQEQYAGLMMTTNHEQVVQAAATQRRFAVIHSSNAVANNPRYFKSIAKLVNDRETAVAMFRFLRARDISQVHLGSSIPRTELSEALATAARPIVHQYLEHVVEVAVTMGPEALHPMQLPAHVMASDLYKRMLVWASEANVDTRYYNPTAMGLDLRKVEGVTKKRTNAGNQYVLPGAEMLRRALDKMNGPRTMLAGDTAESIRRQIEAMETQDQQNDDSSHAASNAAPSSDDDDDALCAAAAEAAEATMLDSSDAFDAIRALATLAPSSRKRGRVDGDESMAKRQKTAESHANVELYDSPQPPQILF
jgi:hypothetical protein